MLRQKELYIANRIKVEKNSYGIDMETFDTPKCYKFFYMPTSNNTDYQLYGVNIGEIYVCYIDYNRYLGKFKVGDRAYLIDNELTDLSIAGNDVNCENANYRIESVLPQNLKIKLTFVKIR